MRSELNANTLGRNRFHEANKVWGTARAVSGTHTWHRRTDVDGLRALAILGVLIFHARSSWMPGGFLGVDVFFVISGYLITGVLQQQQVSGSFDIGAFYAARARRLLPSLLMVLLACAVTGWFVLLPSEFKQLGRHLAGASYFASNFLLWSESGYFDHQAATKPLLHLWSLGVEEQFYCIWPILLLAASRLRHRGQWIAASVLGLFVLELWQTGQSSSAAFYAPWCRFWELMVGAALMIRRGTPCGLNAWARQHADRLSYLFASVLALSFFYVNEAYQVPGWIAVLPVMATAGLIWVGHRAAFNRRVLSRPAMLWIGQLSYPMYLWHWPLLVFARLILMREPSNGELLMLMAATVSIAWASTRWIEQPIRYGAHGGFKATALLLALACLGMWGHSIDLRDGLSFRKLHALGRFPGPLSADLQLLDSDFDWKRETRWGSCHLQEPEEFVHAKSCIEGSKPLVFIWGDSHAASLYTGFHAWQQQHHFGLAQNTAAGCPPIQGIRVGYRTNCADINERVIARLKNTQPQLIVLHAHWSSYFSDVHQLSQAVLATVLTIRKVTDAKILLVGPTPVWRESLMMSEANAIKTDPLHRPLGNRLAFGLVAGINDFDRELMRLALANDLLYWSPYEALCDETGCLTHVGPTAKDITMMDADHLSPSGATFLVSHMAHVLLKAGVQ